MSGHPHFWKQFAYSLSVASSFDLTPYGLSCAVMLSSSFWNWIALTSYNLRCAVMISSSFWNWIASNDLTSYNLSGTVMPSSFWNAIAPVDLTSIDFLQFEWPCHAGIASSVSTSFSGSGNVMPSSLLETVCFQ